jgi:hypothetical protein
LEDFHAREKITHFDHERIPERVVHARGAGAYGFFEPYDDCLAEYTAAKFLTTPGARTPVFVRFSTVAGSRGSADTVRDVRGFATKFYTEQGNYDLVGNNFPVFFIQDGIKFPDFVHAVKPEPHNEIPQLEEHDGRGGRTHRRRVRLRTRQGRGARHPFGGGGATRSRRPRAGEPGGGKAGTARATRGARRRHGARVAVAVPNQQCRRHDRVAQSRRAGR